jgi:hypothetical protein
VPPVRTATLLAVALASALSAACGVFKPPDELDHDARAFMALVARDQLDSAMGSLQVEGNPDTLRSLLQQGHDFISAYALDSAQLVGWNVVKMGDTRGTLTYETHGGPGSAVLTVGVVRAESSSRITGFRWQPMAAPLADLNAFSLSGRTLVHYVYLTLAGLSVIACFGGAIFAGVRKMGVLWILLCLVGVGKATINWTTGGQAFSPFSIQLFGAGYFRPGTVGPWFVSWSLPLGTIIMLLKWRARRTKKSPAEPPVAA